MAVLKIRNENGIFEGVGTIKGEKGEKGERSRDGVPIYTIVEYEGEEIPDGWEEVEDIPEHKNTICAKASQDGETSSLNGWQQIPLNKGVGSTDGTTGSIFYLEDSYSTPVIRVDATGVTYVKVSGVIFAHFENDSGNVCEIGWGIVKNGSEFDKLTMRKELAANTTIDEVFIIPPVVFSVTDETSLNLGIYSSVTGISKYIKANSYITVEEI